MPRLLLWSWPALLTVVIVLPMLSAGYVLSYDMVFVPRQSWRPSFLGLGGEVPRAVPSDAVVSLLTMAVPGQVVQKVVLVAVLAGSGYAMLRLTTGEPAVVRLVATTFYLWNPYVAERLALGQWVVLLAYASLPMVLRTALSVRARQPGATPRLLLWMVPGALSASGALMVLVILVAVILRSPRRWSGRWLAAGTGFVALNAPWWTAGLLHASDAVTGRAGVDAFAANGEGPLPAVLSVVSLGGVWNGEVVPASRTTWLTVLMTVLVIALGVAGGREVRRRSGPSAVVPLAVTGVVGYAVAVLGVILPGALATLTDAVPGVATIRDGTRFLGLLALPLAYVVGWGAHRVVQGLRDHTVRGAAALGIGLLPVVAMPDLAWGVGGGLDPVGYPPSWADARAALVADGAEGGVLVLPATPYRSPAWNDERPVVDPATRYFPGSPMIASTALTVDDRVVDVESVVVEVAVDAVERRDEEALARLGIRYVVAQRDAGSAVLDVGTAIYDSDLIAVARLEGTRPTASESRDVALVALAGGAAATPVAAGLAGAAVGLRRRRRSGRPESRATCW